MIVPTARTTMDTAMGGGTMEKVISTAASLAAIKAARTEFQQFRIITAEYIESGSRSWIAPESFCIKKTTRYASGSKEGDSRCEIKRKISEW